MDICKPMVDSTLQKRKILRFSEILLLSSFSTRIFQALDSVSFLYMRIYPAIHMKYVSFSGFALFNLQNAWLFMENV